MGSESVGLLLQSALAGKLFTMSKNCLALGGVVLPGPARPPMSKHQAYRTLRT